ncbi:Pheromone a factor receptor [Paramyrothecium foliicola]|nr:Pheromone a factor receptor [Paramyrothecium foliicola]
MESSGLFTSYSSNIVKSSSLLTHDSWNTMEPPRLFTRDSPQIMASSTGAPFTTPSLTTNLAFRVTLAILANLVSLVPLRLLYKNGEFAATVFILNVELKNMFTIVYSLMWRNDNMEAWWPGYGLCDVYPSIFNIQLALFVTCLMAIMRNLAHQVGLLRANPLTVREKRRRNLIQALIMFPLPLVQLGFTWPLTMQRYAVGTLVGCIWMAYPAWPYLVFFIIAPVIVALITAGYAILVYFRFRQVAKNTQSALASNRVALMRANRTRRRLYLMVISILTPFLPVICTLTVLNIFDMGTLRPFNYNRIHNHAHPYPWNTILYVSSEELGFSFLNNAYIAILSSIPIFVFFGMTADAMNDYRRILLALGLGRFFPRLHREYDPDRSARETSSLSSSRVLSSGGTSAFKTKFTSRPNAPATSSSLPGGSTIKPQFQSPNFLTSIDIERAQLQQPSPPTDAYQRPAEADVAVQPRLPPSNPFLFRTKFDLPNPFHLSSFRTKQREDVTQPAVPLKQLENRPSRNWNLHAGEPHVRTHVWSEEELALCDDRAVAPPTASADSLNGVMVETALTRETHPAHPQ